LEKLDWDVKVCDPLPEGATEAMAEAQKKFLRSRYDLIENLTDVFGLLERAEFRSFTILQKHRYEGGQNDGAVRELHWLPQETWCRDGQYGDWYYNKDSNFGIGLDGCKTSLGEKNRIGSEFLPREEFVIREVEAGLYEIYLLAFVNWAMARKDNAAFVEIFGLPNGVVIMPPNVPAEREAEYQAAAEKVADGVSGALPNQSDIKFPTASVRGEAPFKSFYEAQDADVVLAGTGGRLAMLTADKGGLGDGPSQEHADAFDEISQASARKISSVLQKDFDAVELAQQFPNEPRCVYFELAAPDEDDVSAIVTDVQKLSAAGYQADVDWLQEKTGYKLAAVETPPPTDPNNPQIPPINADPVRNRLRNSQSAPSAKSAEDVAAATADDLQPVLKALDEGLQQIFTISDPALRLQKFRALWAATAQLRQDAAAYPALALELQKINAAALVRGLKGEAP
jgi:hypothetical protein